MINPLFSSTFKELCNRWQITEIALFGSILRDDFNSESDTDYL
jgi:predicted nucleotidyltransferase